MATHRILFVCLGNICRSPTAEGVFRKLVSERGVAELFEIDSAGMGDWHIGAPPDRRAQQAALARGVDLATLKARKVKKTDIDYFDTIIAMDIENQCALEALAVDENRSKIRLLLDFSDTTEALEVPDPYYGGEHGFELVLDLIEAACEQLLYQINNLEGNHGR